MQHITLPDDGTSVTSVVEEAEYFTADGVLDDSQPLCWGTHAPYLCFVTHLRLGAKRLHMIKLHFCTWKKSAGAIIKNIVL